jgi:hypothetical protein
MEVLGGGLIAAAFFREARHRSAVQVLGGCLHFAAIIRHGGGSDAKNRSENDSYSLHVLLPMRV